MQVLYRHILRVLKTKIGGFNRDAASRIVSCGIPPNSRDGATKLFLYDLTEFVLSWLDGR